MSNKTTAPTRVGGLYRDGWLAPERMIMGLLCFLTVVGACVAGLLLAAA